jgi:tellurite resistance protein TerA
MRDRSSHDAIAEADRYQAEKSRHGGIGAAGFINPDDVANAAGFLARHGDTAIVNPHKNGFENFTIGVAWDVVHAKRNRNGFFARLLKMKPKKVKKFVDLDLGCIYELQNGKKGALQAFGKTFGSLESEPFIRLSGDERTGVTEGHDEVITVSGAHWGDVKRLLIYIYIYNGAENWEEVRPQIQVRVPGEPPMVVSLKNRSDKMVLSAIATLENVRGGIRMTNIMEYFPGHPSMDRAFGFGLEWEDGAKDA